MSRIDDYQEHRGLVFTIAYDITGSVADAEDVAQEVYLAWQASTADVSNPRAYLARAATRHALNSVRASQRQREDYVGPWLPDPLPTGVQPLAPEDAAVTSEAVSMAMLIVLQSLSEDQRAAFILHDIFDFEYHEVALALGGTQASARQLVHRAREHVRGRRARNEVSTQEHNAVVQRFMHAGATGDVAALLELLAPTAVLTTDSNGKASAARRPVVGADNVLRFLLGLMAKTPDVAVEVIELNGLSGMVFREPNGLVSVFQLDVHDGRIEAIFIMRNPERLTHLG